MTDQPQPLWSAEAERAVLASMLMVPDLCVDQASEVLEEKSFFDPKNQALFKAMVEMRAEQKPIDPTTLLAWLKDKAITSVTGEHATMGELMAAHVTHLNLKGYIAIVKEKALQRLLQRACLTILADILDNQDRPAEVILRAEKAILEVVSEKRLGRKTEFTAKEMEKQFKEDVDKAIEDRMNGRASFGLLTGINSVDRSTGGFFEGQLVIVAAKTSVGKSIVLSQFTLYNCIGGTSGGMITPEMTVMEVFRRKVASQTAINTRDMRTGLIAEDAEAYEKAMATAKDLGGMPLVIDDRAPISMDQIRSLARRWKKDYDIQFLVVDYLQLIKPSQKHERKDLEIGEISGGLKELAKELSIRVIAGCQLNRKSSDNEEPQLSHLRESGNIEQDADVVMMMWRPDEKDRRTITVKYPKVRDGAGGMEHTLTLDTDRLIYT